MTKVKLCGFSRDADIKGANSLKPDYIGFVFAKKSKRYVSKEEAIRLKSKLDKDIKVVGVFVDEKIETILEYLEKNIIDIPQLHGKEDNNYIEKLKKYTDKPIIKAFQIKKRDDLESIEACKADYLLLDAGAGDGKTFNWQWLENVKRPYFLAGGLNCNNVTSAIDTVEFHNGNLYAVDVSSGIETNGVKDYKKMKTFIDTVRRKSKEKKL
ncbi:phosphoribosylanthranilate isomerase [Lachnospiraceae bacterium C7]|nr:phosphoribosylanthranilate isomerase [Lachnospiraceae bacterium C7]